MLQSPARQEPPTSTIQHASAILLPAASMPFTDLPNELLLKIPKDTYPPTAFNDPKDYAWCYDQDGEMKKTDTTMIKVSLTCHLFNNLTNEIVETHVITQAEKNGGRLKPGISGWKDVIWMREFLKARYVLCRNGKDHIPIYGSLRWNWHGNDVNFRCSGVRILCCVWFDQHGCELSNGGVIAALVVIAAKRFIIWSTRC